MATEAENGGEQGEILLTSMNCETERRMATTLPLTRARLMQ